MSSNPHPIHPDDDEKIREVQPSDIGGSEPSHATRADVFEESGVAVERDHQVPPEIREAVNERSLADRIRREHSGNGMVAVDKRSGDVIAIADDLHTLKQDLDDSNVPPNNRLVVSCHE